MFLIIGNIIVMAIEYDDMPRDFEGILNNFSEFFTVSFIIECILKLYVSGMS